MTNPMTNPIDLARECGANHIKSGEPYPCEFYQISLKQLRQYHARVRAEAMEQCVKVCDRTAGQFHNDALSMFGDGAAACSDAIRALMPTGGK